MKKKIEKKKKEEIGGAGGESEKGKKVARAEDKGAEGRGGEIELATARTHSTAPVTKTVKIIE